MKVRRWLCCCGDGGFVVGWLVSVIDLNICVVRAQRDAVVFAKEALDSPDIKEEKDVSAYIKVRHERPCSSCCTCSLCRGPTVLLSENSTSSTARRGTASLAATSNHPFHMRASTSSFSTLASLPSCCTSVDSHAASRSLARKHTHTHIPNLLELGSLFFLSHHL